MLELDGKVVDLTKPETLKGITFKEGGYIEQSKDGTVVRIEKVEKQLAPTASNGVPWNNQPAE